MAILHPGACADLNMFHVILLVTCQHPGLGQGSLNDPFEGGGSDHEKIYRDFEGVLPEKVPCLGWSKAVTVSVGTEAALRRAFLLPFLAVSAASVGLAGGWRVRKSDVGGRNIYGRGSKVDLYCSITGTVFNQKGTKN